MRRLRDRRGLRDGGLAPSLLPEGLLWLLRLPEPPKALWLLRLLLWEEPLVLLGCRILLLWEPRLLLLWLEGLLEWCLALRLTKQLRLGLWHRLRQLALGLAKGLDGLLGCHGLGLRCHRLDGLRHRDGDRDGRDGDRGRRSLGHLWGLLRRDVDVGPVEGERRGRERREAGPSLAAINAVPEGCSLVGTIRLQQLEVPLGAVEATLGRQQLRVLRVLGRHGVRHGALVRDALESRHFFNEVLKSFLSPLGVHLVQLLHPSVHRLVEAAG